VLGRRSIQFLTVVVLVALLAESGGGSEGWRSSGTALGETGAPHFEVSHPDAAPIAAATAFTSDVWQPFAVPSDFPQVREFGLASDPADRSVILFGGCGGGSCYGGDNETWVESNGVWTALHPPLSPPSRWGGMMAWDPVDQYVLLFGGSATGPLNDTWAFKNGTWNPVIPSGPSPPPTDEGALAYDPSDRVMVLYGGTGCSFDCPTWLYSGGTWTEDSTFPRPPTRIAEAFAEDDADNGALLYGGENASTGPLYDTWLFSHHTWSEVNATATHPVVAEPLAAWDPGLGFVVVRGSGETWAYARGNWTSQGENTSEGVAASELAWDPTTGVLLQVSGCTADVCPSVSIFGFGPQYSVGVVGRGSPCGNYTLGGSAVDPTGGIAVENGTYSLTLRACHGYLLANVSVGPTLTLNVSTQNLTEWNGTVLVRGAGSLTVNFTRIASNPPPTGLDAISVLGLTFLELLLVVVALVSALVTFLVLSRRPSRPRKPKPPPSVRAPPGF
jgi:Galactose oxidase, central domain